MSVIAYDPFVPAVDMTGCGVAKIDDLIQLARRADILSVHAPLTASTRHLVSAPILAAMRDSAIVVNTSRGGLVDERALVSALQDGRIGGAGLDVFEEEPPRVDGALMRLPNVVLSPHVAGVTEESLRDMALGAARLVDDVFAGRRPPTLLNADIWEDRKR